ncbi:uncharacterized protein LOC107609271 [Arachis ipaensis]|uniref:uncharacterized protein LOC107609271 n=1 Tax=Arachis ipaensis TaxID=130454 RepID=UPI0007AF916A|nr:uncharacterized protein LOC107609271 [Arachis ipaensis]
MEQGRKNRGQTCNVKEKGLEEGEGGTEGGAVAQGTATAGGCSADREVRPRAGAEQGSTKQGEGKSNVEEREKKKEERDGGRERGDGGGAGRLVVGWRDEGAEREGMYGSGMAGGGGRLGMREEEEGVGEK